MYIMIKIETLKELYRRNRVLQEQNERYLRIISRIQADKVEAEKERSPFDGLFSGCGF